MKRISEKLLSAIMSIIMLIQIAACITIPVSAAAMNRSVTENHYSSSIADYNNKLKMYAAKYSSTDYTVIHKFDPITELPIGLRDTGFEMNALDNGSIYVKSPDYNTNKGVHPTAAVTTTAKGTLDNLEVVFDVEQELFFQNNGFGSSFSVCWTTQPVITLPESLYYISQNGMRGYPVDANGATGDDLNYGLYVVFVSPRNYSNTSVAYDVYVIFDSGSYSNTLNDGWHGYRWIYEGLDINLNNDVTVKVSPDAANGYVVNVNGTKFTNANDVSDYHENITMNFSLLKGKTGYVTLCSSGGFQKNDTCNFTWKKLNGYGPAYGLHDHQMSAEKVVVKEPGCIDGRKAYACSLCDFEKEAESIPALYDGHNYESNVTPPTCTSDGFTTYTCSRCDDAYIDTKVFATGHNLSEWLVKTPATCTAKGTEVRKCTNTGCTYEETRPTIKLAHTPGEWIIDSAATCTIGGSKHKKCTVCNKVLGNEPIPATGHSPGEWSVKTPATCFDAGTEVRKCTNVGCIYEEIRAIAKTAHNLGEWAVLTPATCSAEGIEAKKCTNTGCTYYEGTRATEKLAHIPGELVIGKYPTENEEGQKVKKCTVCGETLVMLETQPIPALSEWQSCFNDVKVGDWYYEAVRFANTMGMVNGISADTFSPNSQMTRGMLVTLLGRLAGVSETAYPSEKPFNDVETNEWYSSYVAWAKETGIVGGYPDGTFAPNKTISRLELALLFMNYANKIDKTDVTAWIDLEKFAAFTDSASVPEWAKYGMLWATSVGLMNGSLNLNGTLSLDLDNPALRSHVAQMVFNYCTKVVSE